MFVSSSSQNWHNSCVIKPRPAHVLKVHANRKENCTCTKNLLGNRGIIFIPGGLKITFALSNLYSKLDRHFVRSLWWRTLIMTHCWHGNLESYLSPSPSRWRRWWLYVYDDHSRILHFYVASLANKIQGRPKCNTRYEAGPHSKHFPNETICDSSDRIREMAIFLAWPHRVCVTDLFVDRRRLYKRSGTLISTTYRMKNDREILETNLISIKISPLAWTNVHILRACEYFALLWESNEA